MGGFLALFARGLEWTSAFFGAYGFLQIMFTVLEDESNLSDRYGGDSETFFPVCSFGFQPFSQPFLSFYGFLDVEGEECNLRNAKGKGGNGLYDARIKSLFDSKTNLVQELD